MPSKRFSKSFFWSTSEGFLKRNNWSGSCSFKPNREFMQPTISFVLFSPQTKPRLSRLGFCDPRAEEKKETFCMRHNSSENFHRKHFSKSPGYPGLHLHGLRLLGEMLSYFIANGICHHSHLLCEFISSSETRMQTNNDSYELVYRNFVVSD